MGVLAIEAARHRREWSGDGNVTHAAQLFYRKCDVLMVFCIQQPKDSKLFADFYVFGTHNLFLQIFLVSF